jgi:hypothetical protein
MTLRASGRRTARAPHAMPSTIRLKVGLGRIAYAAMASSGR